MIKNTIIGALAIVMLFFMFKCDSAKKDGEILQTNLEEIQSMYDTEKQSAETYKTANGDLVSKNQSLQLTTAEMEEAMKVATNKHASLSRKYRQRVKQITVLTQSINDGTLSDSTQLVQWDTIEVPADTIYIVEADSNSVDPLHVCPTFKQFPTYSGIFADTSGTLAFGWSADEEALELVGISFDNEVTMAHTTKKRIFRPNLHTVTASSSNPYWNKQDVKTYEVKEKRRLFSIVAGVGPSISKFRKGPIKYGNSLVDPETTVTLGYSAGIFVGIRLY